MSKHKHKEAFCEMTYKCNSCNKKEIIWNSRDGITPFVVSCRYCGKDAIHVEWNNDKAVIDKVIKKGDRIFIDFPESLKRPFAITEFEKTKNEADLKFRDEIIKNIIECFIDGEPYLITF